MTVNRVMLLGRLGKDPETKTLPSGTSMVTFSLATSERKKGKDGAKAEYETEWHNIIAFGKTGETCAAYLKKGSQIFLEGKIQTRKWQADDGKDRYTTSILVDRISFVGDKKSGDAPTAAAGSGNEENSTPHEDSPF